MLIKNFSKRYGDNVVYENFNLDIQEGKITCVLGESGSGKTTLLNALANLTAYEGEIPENKCAYVFQTPRLIPNLTVAGNLKLVCKDKEKIAEVLTLVGLSDKAESYPVKLSGGEAQRVAIARAVLFGGDVWLLDEPFNSLDLKTRLSVINLLFKIFKEKSPTVIFVTHDVGEAAYCADRIVVIDKGKIVGDVTPQGETPRTGEEFEKLRRKLVGILLSETNNG